MLSCACLPPVPVPVPIDARTRRYVRRSCNTFSCDLSGVCVLGGTMYRPRGYRGANRKFAVKLRSVCAWVCALSCARPCNRMRRKTYRPRPPFPANCALDTANVCGIGARVLSLQPQTQRNRCDPLPQTPHTRRTRYRKRNATRCTRYRKPMQEQSGRLRE